MIKELYFDVVAKDGAMIKYRPQWTAITGSVTSAILLAQICYWYDKNDRKPFYKYKTAPKSDNPRFKEGDDWCTELGFTRREFDGALEKIGFKITKDVRERIEGGEKVQHFKLIEYWTTSERVTYYKVNMVNFELIMSGLFLKHKNAFTKSTIVDLAKVQNVLYQKYKSDFTKSAIPPLYNSEDYNSKLLQETTTRESTRTREDFEKNKIELLNKEEKTNASPPVAPPPPNKITSEDIQDFDQQAKVVDLSAGFMEEPAQEVIDEPDMNDWMIVSRLMADFLEGEGKDRWRILCESAKVKVDEIKPIEVTVPWASKASPSQRRAWVMHTGKLTNYIKNAARSNREAMAKKREHEAKMKNFQKWGQVRGGNKPEGRGKFDYEKYENGTAKRPIVREFR